MSDGVFGTTALTGQGTTAIDSSTTDILVELGVGVADAADSITPNYTRASVIRYYS